MAPFQDNHSPADLVAQLAGFIDLAVERAGGDTHAIKPGHRIPFVWPPHRISLDYHLKGSDWNQTAEFEAHGEVFEVQVAETTSGVFGRSTKLWHEARGDNLEHMLQELRSMAEPLFTRQEEIARTLDLEGRFEGKIRDLSRWSLVRLLYCPNRDVGHEAITVIESHASTTDFGPVLTAVLRDRRHPYRRVAHWNVLDLFEDMPSFCKSPSEQTDAILAIRDLMWDASDDFARAIFKAGGVLGGHICTDEAADALFDCLKAPSRIGRRSAIHAVFHLAEWLPTRKDEVLAGLRWSAEHDPEPALCSFASAMARDVAAGEVDHIAEPVFPDEP